jgi:carboxymethylenebutenolidase
MPAKNIGKHVVYPSNGREAHGYLVLPEQGTGPAVIVIQEWWGVTEHIRDVTERLAEAGFVAMAPDLYGGETTHSRDEARRMMAELPEDQAVSDLKGAVGYLQSLEVTTGSHVGVVGFCMGGTFVLRLACAASSSIGAAVCFYPILARGIPPVDGLQAPVLGHFAENDAAAGPELVEELSTAIQKAGGTANFYTYPGSGHAFFNDENRLGTYHPEHARTAWNRTIGFLYRNL